MSATARISTTGLIVVAAIAAALGLWLGARFQLPTAGTAQSFLSAKLYPEPRIIAPFRLTRGDGTDFSERDFRGRWTLVFFGYTHCPDVCPTTLGSFAQIEKDLVTRAPGAAVAYLFVSVDPERDTPKGVAEYSAYFSPAIVAAVGDLDTLNAMTPNLGVVFMKSEQPDGSYQIDHSASVLLIDPAARLAGVFRPPFEVKAIAADLAMLSARK